MTNTIKQEIIAEFLIQQVRFALGNGLVWFRTFDGHKDDSAVRNASHALGRVIGLFNAFQNLKVEDARMSFMEKDVHVLFSAIHDGEAFPEGFINGLIDKYAIGAPEPWPFQEPKNKNTLRLLATVQHRHLNEDTKPMLQGHLRQKLQPQLAYLVASCQMPSGEFLNSLETDISIHYE